jgi:hypothetical protein
MAGITRIKYFLPDTDPKTCGRGGFVPVKKKSQEDRYSRSLSDECTTPQQEYLQTRWSRDTQPAGITTDVLFYDVPWHTFFSALNLTN